MKNVIQGTTLSGTGAVSIAPGAEITIRNPSGQLVPLWADRAGTQPHDNPFLTDNEGNFRVYADSGWVHVRAQKDGSVREWRYVPLGSAAAMDIGEVYEALGAEVYSSVSAGLSNSAEGDFFLVESGGALDLYRVVNGVAEQRAAGIDDNAILATRAYADGVAAEAESNATNAAAAAASSAYQQATEYSDSQLQTHRESGDHDGRYYTKTEIDQALEDKVDDSDPRLSDARDWIAPMVTQAEVEGGESTEPRKWSVEMVKLAAETYGGSGSEIIGPGPDQVRTNAENDARYVRPPDLYIGKPTTDPATPITGSLLSGAMLAAGAIVEMGANANGSYWRWESGLQVCVSPLLATAEYSGFADRVQASWTYPAVFHAIPKVLPGRDGSITAQETVYGVPASLAITTTSAELRLIDAEGRFAPGQQYASVFGLAIGAWK